MSASGGAVMIGAGVQLRQQGKAKSIDVYRDRLKGEAAEAKKASHHLAVKVQIMEILEALPFFDRIDFTADLADYYGELDTRPEES